MFEEVKILLGESAENFTDAQIYFCIEMAITEVFAYTGLERMTVNNNGFEMPSELNRALELCAVRIAVMRLNRLGSEGLNSESYSSVNNNYLNDYPEDIKAIMNQYKSRKIKLYEV